MALHDRFVYLSLGGHHGVAALYCLSMPFSAIIDKFLRLSHWVVALFGRVDLLHTCFGPRVARQSALHYRLSGNNRSADVEIVAGVESAGKNSD